VLQELFAISLVHMNEIIHKSLILAAVLSSVDEHFSVDRFRHKLVNVNI
jgi:hypothetical protein